MNLPDHIQPKFHNDIGYCQEKCPSYDGKRCEVMGFHPESICEPWLNELIYNYKELTRYISDGTPFQSDDYTRGEDAAWNQAIREFNKWLDEKEKRSGSYRKDLQSLYERVWSLKYIQQMWGEECEKLQQVIQKYSLGKAGDDIFDLAVQNIEENNIIFDEDLENTGW